MDKTGSHFSTQTAAMGTKEEVNEAGLRFWACNSKQEGGKKEEGRVEEGMGTEHMILHVWAPFLRRSVCHGAVLRMGKPDGWRF